LEAIGATDLKRIFVKFVEGNQIDVNNLDSFKVESIEEFVEQTKRYDFDSFDEQFYNDEILHQQIIDYARKHIDQIMKA